MPIRSHDETITAYPTARERAATDEAEAVTTTGASQAAKAVEEDGGFGSAVHVGAGVYCGPGAVVVGTGGALVIVSALTSTGITAPVARLNARCSSTTYDHRSSADFSNMIQEAHPAATPQWRPSGS